MVLELCRKAWLFCSLTFFACLLSKSFYCIGETKLLHHESNKRALEHTHTVPVVSNVLSVLLVKVFLRCLIKCRKIFKYWLLLYISCIFHVFLLKATCHSLFFFTRQTVTSFSFGEFILCLPLHSPEYGCDTWICSLCASGFSLCLSIFPSVCLKTNQPPSLPPQSHICTPTLFTCNADVI